MSWFFGPPNYKSLHFYFESSDHQLNVKHLAISKLAVSFMSCWLPVGQAPHYYFNTPYRSTVYLCLYLPGSPSRHRAPPPSLSISLSLSLSPPIYLYISLCVSLFPLAPLAPRPVFISGPLSRTTHPWVLSVIITRYGEGQVGWLGWGWGALGGGWL